MAGTAEAIGENILEQAADWRRSGRGVAVATDVATWLLPAPSAASWRSMPRAR